MSGGPVSSAGGGSQGGAGRSRRPRAVLIGLDGAPFSLLHRFAREGVMPELARIFAAGSTRPMQTALPEISSVAWATFLTGVNPGKHAVYGFLDVDPRSYKLSFTSYASVRAQPLWDRLAERGLRSVVINVPTTYPARPMKGVLVSGFVAIDLKRAVYPPEVLRVLERMGYKLDVDTETFKVSTEAFLAELDLALERRQEALWHFLTTEEHDLFIGVVTETDRLHHYLWAALDEESHPCHAFFLDYYRKIDRFLARVRERIGPDDLFVILSDHGFCKIESEVYLNHWLRERGDLSFDTVPPKTFGDMASATRAFALEPSRIHLHTAGKYARGSVAPSQAPALREELKAALEALAIGGRPVIREVHRKEDLYSGPYLDGAPDLLLVPHRGFDLKGSLYKDRLAGTGVLTGMHTDDDAVLCINRPLAGEEPAHIADLVPMVLAHFGLPIPPELDGRSRLG